MNILRKPRVIAVAAHDENYGIGLGDQLPWHCSADLRHFKALTLHGVVVMGRKTALGLQKPLPHRHNYVLTRDPDRHIPELARLSDQWTVTDNLDTILREAVQVHHVDRVFVIGGAQVYESLVGAVDELYLTRIPGTHEVDTYFPYETYGLTGRRGPFQLEAGRGLGEGAVVQHWVRR